MNSGKKEEQDRTEHKRAIVIVTSPHASYPFDTISVGDPGGGFGLELLADRLSVSPGLRCKVGDSNPSGVTKQNSVRPTSSTVV